MPASSNTVFILVSSTVKRNNCSHSWWDLFASWCHWATVLQRSV